MAEAAPDIVAVYRLVQKMDHKVTTIEQKLGNHGKRLDDHDKRFDAHDKRFDAIDKRLDDHDQRFDAIDQRFDRLEERMERGFSQLGMQIENVQSTVQLLAEQMSEFSRSQRDVRGRVDRLEEKQELTELRLRLLEKAN